MRALILQSKSSMPSTSYARAQTTDYLNNHSNLFYRENLIGKRYLNMHTTHTMETRKRLTDRLFKYTHCSINFNWSVKVSQSCIVKESVLQDLLEALTIVKTLWSSNVLFHYIINCKDQCLISLTSQWIPATKSAETSKRDEWNIATKLAKLKRSSRLITEVKYLLVRVLDRLTSNIWSWSMLGWDRSAKLCTLCQTKRVYRFKRVNLFFQWFSSNSCLIPSAYGWNYCTSIYMLGIEKLWFVH